MARSLGRSFNERPAQLDEEARGWPSPGTNLWPTPMQADLVAGLIRRRGLSACSIGCGEGAAEAMLERRGVKVTSVDLDVLTDTAGYGRMRRFCTAISRVRPCSLFDLGTAAEARATCLCFFWGRATPWQAYLDEYPAVTMVIIAGDPASAALGGRGDGDCATEPSADALESSQRERDEWFCLHRMPVRAVSRSALLSVYVRRGDGAACRPPMPPPPPPATAATPANLVGRFVMLHSLSRADLNGKVGSCCSWDEAKGRAGIKLGSRMIAVRPTNLAIVPGEPTAAEEEALALEALEEALEEANARKRWKVSFETLQSDQIDPS